MGWALTVPSCPSGPAAACDAAASSSSWGRTGGYRVTVGVEGRQPPAQPASACSAFAPDGWAALSASWASALPLAPASPLAAPPPAPRSLLYPSLSSRSPSLPGPPRPLARPRESLSAGRRVVHRLCAQLLPVRPAQSRWREAGKPAPATAPAPGSCPTHRPASPDYK